MNTYWSWPTQPTSTLCSQSLQFCQIFVIVQLLLAQSFFQIVIPFPILAQTNSSYVSQNRSTQTKKRHSQSLGKWIYFRHLHNAANYLIHGPKKDPASSLWNNFQNIFKCRTVSDFLLASLLNDQVPSPSFIVVINGISASSFFSRQPSVSSSSWLFQQNNWSFQVRQAL